MPGPRLPLLGADPNRPDAVALVGRYALGVTWQDRHGSIYPFSALRAACPCGGCFTDENPWPAEIRREVGHFRIVWQDGHESHVPYVDLRRRCPCAQCATTPREASR